MKKMLALEVELFKQRDFEFVTNGQFAKQEQALLYLTDQETEELDYGGAAGGAKSWTGCVWLLFMCLAYPGTKYFIGREELKRLRESTLLTFYKVCKKHGVEQDKDFKYNGTDHFIEFTNGSRIDLLDLKMVPADPLYERFGSLEFTSGWIEEAGEIHLMAYEVLRTRINRHMNTFFGIKKKLLVTFNPKKNWLYLDVYKPFKKGELPAWRKFLPSLVQDNPFIERGYIENLQGIKDKVMKERLLYGSFEYDEDPAILMEYDAIIDIFTNQSTEENPRQYVSVDVARFGGDKTTIGRWSGFQLKEIQVYSKKSTTEIVKILEGLEQDYQIPRSHFVIDEDGVGGGVVDQLKGCKGFINNSSALQPAEAQYDDRKKVNYANLKTQCYFLLADKVNEAQLGVDSISDTYRDMIIQELEQVKRIDVDKETKVKIVSKEEVKERIGRSPDFSDMMMMRMLFELNKPAPLKKKERKEPQRFNRITGEPIHRRIGRLFRG